MSHAKLRSQSDLEAERRCQAFAVIARNARSMLQARKRYMDMLPANPSCADAAQIELQNAVKNLERSVDFATQSNLWD